MSKALVILSGGQDSTTCLFWAKQQYEEVHAITFDYGQRHKLEIEAAQNVAKLADVASHRIANVGGILVSSSPLISDNELEQYQDFEQMDAIIGDRVELTFVPLRNPFFFLIAANHAIAIGCTHLVTGICQQDNANYPDCTGVFRQLIEATINEAVRGHSALRIVSPLLDYSKSESVKLAANLPGCWGALAFTHTSYDGKYPPTDKNHANVLRAYGFEDACYPDPLVIRAWLEGLMPLPETANYVDGGLRLHTIAAIKEAHNAI